MGQRLLRSPWLLGAVVVASALAPSVGCVDSNDGPGGPPSGETPGNPPPNGAGNGNDPAAPPGLPVPTAEEQAAIVGATADGVTHIVSNNWKHVDVAHGDNVKMLNFEQLKLEVERATGVPFPVKPTSRALFGGADYTSTFQDDRTPGATKLVTMRKVSFEVCGAMMAKEVAKPALFSAIPPKSAIGEADPKVVDQVKLVFTRFFQEEAKPAEITASTKALVDSVAAGTTPDQAWMNLCVGYLSSMRFLAY